MHTREPRKCAFRKEHLRSFVSDLGRRELSLNGTFSTPARLVRDIEEYSPAFRVHTMCGITQQTKNPIAVTNSDDFDNRYADAEESLGPIEPMENDVLLGRGNGVQAHSGNQNYLKVVEFHKVNYSMSAPRCKKILLAETVISFLRSLDPPGRFLERLDDSYVVIPQKKAVVKVMQALRKKPALTRSMAQASAGISFSLNYRFPLTNTTTHADSRRQMRLVPNFSHRQFALERGIFYGEDGVGFAYARRGQSPSLHGQSGNDTVKDDLSSDQTCSTASNTHDNSDIHMKKASDLFSDQFSGAPDDDTTAYVAIFHQCRRYGML
jgi:hypothetical protein